MYPLYDLVTTLPTITLLTIIPTCDDRLYRGGPGTKKKNQLVEYVPTAHAIRYHFHKKAWKILLNVSYQVRLFFKENATSLALRNCFHKTGKTGSRTNPIPAPTP